MQPSSSIESSVLVEIAPLAETNHTVNETENDVKKRSKCITTEFPIATVA